MPTLPLTFEMGLNESVEDSQLPIGAAAKLINWTPEPTGGLRVRGAWIEGASGGDAVSPYQGRGLFWAPRALHDPLRIQHVVNSGTATATTTVNTTATWASATTAARTQIWLITCRSSASDVTWSATRPSGWSNNLLTSDYVNENTASGSVAVFAYNDNDVRSGSQALTITASASVTTEWTVHLLEYDNISTSIAVDFTTSWTDAGNQQTSAAVTPEAERGLLLGIVVADENRTWASYTTGFTELSDTNGTALVEKVATSTSDVTLAATASGAYAAATGLLVWIASKPAPEGTGSYVAGYYSSALGASTIAFLDHSELASGTWDNIAPQTLDGELWAFAQGNGVVIASAPSFDGLTYWDTARTIITGAVSTSGGQALAYYKNRFWAAGPRDAPARLWYSPLGSSWTTAADWSFIDIASQNGEQIYDIAPVASGLLIVKGNSMHLLQGQDPDTFQVTDLQGGGGYKGRCICVTPKGVLIADTNRVWWWSGGSSAQDIGAPIRDSYSLSGDWVTTTYVDGSVYICDEADGTLYVYNTETATWHIETMNDANESPGVIYAANDKLLMSPSNATVLGLINYRNHPGESRSKDPDTLTETFTLWTPEYRLSDADKAANPTRLNLRLRQHAAGTRGLSITPYFDGVAGTAQSVTTRTGAGTFVKRVGIGQKQGVDTVQFRITQSLASGETCAIDIEGMSLDYTLVSRNG